MALVLEGLKNPDEDFACHFIDTRRLLNVWRRMLKITITENNLTVALKADGSRERLKIGGQ